MFRNRAESLSRLIADNRLLEIAQLLDDEVRLKVQITDPALIDKETIEEVVTVAKKLASAGCPLQLVEPDEFLDIAQTFCFLTPPDARIEQELVLEDPQNPLFSTRLTGTKFLDYAAELVTSPNADTASHILVKLQAKLEITDSSVWKDPVWTARVAAVLAYFSALKQ